MISTELYDGQGLGNQLWAYVVTRILADKKSLDFSIIASNRFKGRDFLNIDFGNPGTKIDNKYIEKKEVLKNTDIDISGTDNELYKIKQNTKIDGCFQSVEYLDGYREKIIEWVKIKETYRNITSNFTGDDVCIIHMRCGDFMGAKEVFLPKEYYLNAIKQMKKINRNIKFYCVTDQKDVAEKILPNIKVIGSSSINVEDANKASHHYGGPLGIDFNLILNAKYIILPNSSFSWWATYLNTKKSFVIAPKYWARHNISTGYWSTSDIITDGYSYLDRNGNIFTDKECREEKRLYDLRVKAPNLIDRILNKTNTDSKKYDCFIFYNELDLLEMRLNILNDYVDFFVLVEATKTFTGICKPLFYNQNKKRFSKFSNKIIHIIVDDMPDSFEELVNRRINAGTIEKNIIDLCLTSPNIPKGAVHWLREFYQKEQIHKGLIDAKENDICFISDLDEIWNSEIRIPSISYFNGKIDNRIYRMKQTVYAYFLNNKSSEEWYGTVICSYLHLKRYSINHIRTPGMNKFHILKNGGWHFTFQGGLDAIKNKLSAYGHQEFNSDEIRSNLSDKMQNNQDFIGRNFTFIIDEKKLPKYVIVNKNKYINYFK